GGAVGGREGAGDARDAWVSRAASAGLEPGDAVLEGGERLALADGLLEAGNFAAAIPELRQASQSFRTAIDDGRRELAATRAAFEPGARPARQKDPAAGGPSGGRSEPSARPSRQNDPRARSPRRIRAAVIRCRRCPRAIAPA